MKNKSQISNPTNPLRALAPRPRMEPHESCRLVELEKVLQKGKQAFYYEVGAALCEIRDDHLYRSEFGTFEDYCRIKWKWTARLSRQLIHAASVVAEIGETVIAEAMADTDKPMTVPSLEMTSAHEAPSYEEVENELSCFIHSFAEEDRLKVVEYIMDELCMNIVWGEKEVKSMVITKSSSNLNPVLPAIADGNGIIPKP